MTTLLDLFMQGWLPAAMALLGGAIYRWRGGLTNSDGTQSLVAPRFVRLWIWAMPLPLLYVLANGTGWVPAVGFMWMFAGASLGHAKWQDLGHMDQIYSGRWYWSDVGGLAWSGFLMAGPFGIVSKPVAYMIGWYGFDRQWKDAHPWLRWGTEVGEFLTGFFIYGLMATTIMVIP